MGSLPLGSGREGTDPSISMKRRLLYRLLAAEDPSIYLVSLLPGITVTTFCWPNCKNIGQVLVASIAVVCMQHGINVLNDVTDGRRGTDANKVRTWMTFHSGNWERATVHGLVSWGVGSAVGSAVLIVGGHYHILFIAVPIAVVGFLYNAEPLPLSYSRFSELVTGVVYGVGVFGCLWLVEGSANIVQTICGVIAYGSYSVAILIAHQIPQMDSDRLSDRNTLAMYWGETRSARLSKTLFVTFVVFISLGVCANRERLLLPIAISCSLLGVGVTAAVCRAPVDPLRNLRGGSLYVVGLLLLVAFAYFVSSVLSAK